MKYGFEKKYACFNENIYDQSTEPLLDELDIHVFVDAEHRHEKVTGRLINGLFSVVVSTPTTWSSKCQTTVQTSTFGAKFTAPKKDV